MKNEIYIYILSIYHFLYWCNKFIPLDKAIFDKTPKTQYHEITIYLQEKNKEKKNEEFMSETQTWIKAYGQTASFCFHTPCTVRENG